VQLIKHHKTTPMAAKTGGLCALRCVEPRPAYGFWGRRIMAEQFDVTVIGAGPGGYVAAIRAAQVGLKTAIIERDKDLGGTCLLRGCIPTKELLHSAHVYELLKEPEQFGVEVTGAKLNFPAVMARKNKIVTKLSGGVGFLMKKHKITVFKGQGKLKAKAASPSPMLLAK
jgi:dihydrolipoamide dehydrogenase